MARTERVILDVTYDEATQSAPSTWTWHLGQEIPPGVARLATVFGRAGRLGPALVTDAAEAREDLGRMTTRAVTAEAEIERLRGYITDALDAEDDLGVARQFLRYALRQDEP